MYRKINQVKNAVIITGLLVSSPGKISASENTVTVRGFGTVGYNRLLTLSGAGDNRTSVANFSKEGNTSRDTKLGLNISAKLTDNLQAAIQIVGRSSTYVFGAEKPPYVEVDIGVLTYKPFSWLTLQAGRYYLPSWLISEEATVGYSYPWVRPPTEVYIMTGAQVMDGARVNFQGQAGGAILGGFIMYGLYNPARIDDSQKGRSDNPIGTMKYTEIDGNNEIVGAGASLSVWDTHSLVTVGKTQGDVNLTTVFNSRPTVTSPVNFEVKVTGKNQLDATFFAVGHRANPGNLILIAEWGALNAEFTQPEGAGAFTNRKSEYRGWYTTAGYRISRVTPLFTYARNKISTNYRTLTSQNGGNEKALQESFIGGINIDIAGNVVWKNEVQYTRDVKGTARYGVLGLPPGAKYLVASSSLDFIF